MLNLRAIRYSNLPIGMKNIIFCSKYGTCYWFYPFTLDGFNTLGTTEGSTVQEKRWLWLLFAIIVAAICVTIPFVLVQLESLKNLTIDYRILLLFFFMILSATGLEVSAWLKSCTNIHRCLHLCLGWGITLFLSVCQSLVWGRDFAKYRSAGLLLHNVHSPDNGNVTRTETLLNHLNNFQSVNFRNGFETGTPLLKTPLKLANLLCWSPALAT